MGPAARVAVHGGGAEMLERVPGYGGGGAVFEDEGLRADGAFGGQGHGGDEAELFVDAGANVGVP